MKKNIAILGGGNSSEHEISMFSAENVLESIDKTKYNAYIIELDNRQLKVVCEDTTLDFNTFSFAKNGETIKFDFVFNVIHGAPGEDGSVSGYLNLLNIPHSACDILSSALSFNKAKCNQYLKTFGIKLPAFISFKKGQAYDLRQLTNKLTFPCIVKPTDSGSSFGISKVDKLDELEKAIGYAFTESNEIMVEEFIAGTELSCGLLKLKSQEIILPVTEICFPGEFFDYHHKYFSKKTQEITPARIPEVLAIKTQKICSEIYDLLSCKGIVRLDFILRGSEVYFLELNSIPGITKMSIITNAIKATNFTLTDVLTKVIEDS